MRCAWCHATYSGMHRALCILLLSSSACSSSSSESPATVRYVTEPDANGPAAPDSCDDCDAGPTDVTDATNAEDAGGQQRADAGVQPYPTRGVGTRARVGSRQGDVIGNLHFRGYLRGSKTGGERDILLSDYYGSASTRLLHIIGVARWSSPDHYAVQEVESALPSRPQVHALYVVLQSMSQGSAATTNDLDAMMSKYSSTQSWARDPLAQGSLGQLRPYVDVDAFPLHVTIDTRSMEILDAGIGATLDFATHADTWLAWTQSNPASTY